MTDPVKERLLLQAQLKALTAKFDPQNPLADVKTAVAKLVEGLEAIRGANATRSENDARVAMMHLALDTEVLNVSTTAQFRAELRTTLSEVDAVRSLQLQLFEQLGNAIARANETRAHIALANATLTKLINTVSTTVDAAVERDAARPATAPAPRVLRLQIHMPGLAVREESFDEDVVKVGKLPSSHLKLDDDNVSRMHAVIERVQTEDKQGVEWFVIDLGSAAGTIVNDRKVNKALLNVGDRIIFGGVNITVLG